MAAAVVDKYFTVNINSDADTDAGVELMNGDWVDVSATGTVWSGVWATGRNGPEGWSSWSASGDALVPGVPPFSLLWHTAEDGYLYIASGLRRTYQNATLGPGKTRLSFNINRDPRSRRGDGGFQIHLVVWR
ncbi:hypothetical protein ACTMTJ_13895 [Phytohabitans sp. LJ34]|uniref:hypothetical protein n=1 Tax=Phytohabitans sp. LJ34 TaxID=3452217 RepID=UPI003F88F30A